MIFMCRGGKSGLATINIAYIVGLVIIVFAIVYICLLLFFDSEDIN